MKKGTKKGQVERRKHPRKSSKASVKAGEGSSRASPSGSSKKAAKSAVSNPPEKESLKDMSALSLSAEHCTACAKGLGGDDRALFVEEEVGRVFCSEECITQYFQPEIDEIEKEYFAHRPDGDLSSEEREQYAHLRWVTIQEPDEVWEERRGTGDRRYVLISRFKPGSKSVWCVCVCLFLRGEPSFLYMAFPTRSKALVDRFRRGAKVDRDLIEAERVRQQIAADPSSSQVEEPFIDGIATEWSQSETLQAEIHGTREANDIPLEERALYDALLEKTLENPDELWILESGDDGEPDRYHFIRKFSEEESGEEDVYYVVVAQESEEAEHLEVVEQIPTRNPALVKRFRKGRQEHLLGEEGTNPTIH